MVLNSNTSEHLLRNAQVTAYLLGETGEANPDNVPDELIDPIVRLTSLYA